MANKKKCKHTRLALHLNRVLDVISKVTCDDCGAMWNEWHTGQAIRIMVAYTEPDEPGNGVELTRTLNGVTGRRGRSRG